jgi:beta-glucosidase
VFTDAPPDGVARTGHVVRFRGRLAPPAGRYRLGLTATGPARLVLDGEPVLDIWDQREPGQAFFSHGSAEQTAVVELDGRAHELTAEYHRLDRSLVGGLRVGIAPVLDEDALLDEAVEAAAAADAAVVVVGLTSDWEAEGFDRDGLGLPGRQDELVRRIAAANPRTVVIVNAGSPVGMPWLDGVAAVMQAWYAGQEQGPAIAEVLFGQAEPGGRLPLTIPRRIEDSPAFPYYPGDGGRAVYGEDLLAGYRGYERNGIEPLFPFGHGCGYTTWRWETVSVSGEGTGVSVGVELTNAGPRAGSEVVQVYRRWVNEPDPTRPVRELVGFSRVRAEAGGSVQARIDLDQRAFRRWEDGDWRVPSGEVVLEVGASAGDLRGQAYLRL